MKAESEKILTSQTIRVEIQADKAPTKEQIKEFKDQNPDVKIRVMRDGRVFIYLKGA